MSWDQQYLALIEEVQQHGVAASPTMGATRELIGFHFRLDDPRDRITFNEGRQFNIFQTVGQWLWMMAGRSDYGFIEYYNPNAERFSVDLRQIEGAYGPRIFGPGAYRQIPRCVERLRENPSSRRAVATVYAPTLDWQREKVEDRVGEIPCTIALQFLNRADQLHCIATMRSQDAVMLLPQDVFHFTLFQEFVAASLSVDIGFYQHQAASLHTYERQQAHTERVLAAASEERHQMPPMTKEDQMPFLLETLSLEERIRVNAIDMRHRRGPRGIDAEAHLKEARQLPEFWEVVVQSSVAWAAIYTKSTKVLERLRSEAHPCLRPFIRRALDLHGPQVLLDNYSYF